MGEWDKIMKPIKRVEKVCLKLSSLDTVEGSGAKHILIGCILSVSTLDFKTVRPDITISDNKYPFLQLGSLFSEKLEVCKENNLPFWINNYID